MSKALRCPYCLDDLTSEDQTVRCSDCRTPHHDDCFRENAGCVAFGCSGREQVKGGQSIFLKPAIRIHHEPTAEINFGPFSLGYRKLVSIPEKRPPQRCPDAYARLTFELREIREGETSRGRGVIYVSEETAFKRVDLHLFQGIQRPQQVGRVTLLHARELGKKAVFRRGSHPFYLELMAPAAIPFMDPFQFELVLVRGLFHEVRSLPLPLYLLQRRFQRNPPELPRIHVAARPPEIAIQPRPPSGRLPDVFPPEPDPFAQGDPFADAPDPFAADPFAPPSVANGWCTVPVTSLQSMFDSGGPTGRSVQARFCPIPGSEASDGLTVDAPSMPLTPEFPVRIGGGGAIECLNVAIQYELVRPGGEEVDHPGFPCMEELRLFGAGALEPSSYGNGTGVEMIVSVPSERLTALADARSGIAHNAALRLHIAVDAIDGEGRVLPGVSRSVTFTRG